MAKRGMLIEAVHFHSYPYTSERAREKVYDLVRILASYCGRIRVHSVNLLDIQQAIGENCPEDEMDDPLPALYDDDRRENRGSKQM